MKSMGRIALGWFIIITLAVAMAGCTPQSTTTPAAESPARDSAAPPDVSTAPEGSATAAPSIDTSPREQREAERDAQAGDTPAEAPAQQSSEDMTAAPPQENAEAAPAETAGDASAASGTPITAESIVGTKWSAGGMEIAFEANNVLKAGDQSGTWKINGNTLTVDIGGMQYDATIEGSKIMYEGMEVERVN